MSPVTTSKPNEPNSGGLVFILSKPKKGGMDVKFDKFVRDYFMPFWLVVMIVLVISGLAIQFYKDFILH